MRRWSRCGPARQANSGRVPAMEAGSRARVCAQAMRDFAQVGGDVIWVGDMNWGNQDGRLPLAEGWCASLPVRLPVLSPLLPLTLRGCALCAGRTRGRSCARRRRGTRTTPRGTPCWGVGGRIDWTACCTGQPRGGCVPPSPSPLTSPPLEHTHTYRKTFSTVEHTHKDQGSAAGGSMRLPAPMPMPTVLAAFHSALQPVLSANLSPRRHCPPFSLASPPTSPHLPAPPSVLLLYPPYLLPYR